MSSLVGKAYGDPKTPQASLQTSDWDNALNGYGKDGWVVANSGVIESGSAIVFWALLEKEEREEAINTGF